MHNPGNWHEVPYDSTWWAKQYLEKKLIGLKAEVIEQKQVVVIDRVSIPDGEFQVRNVRTEVKALNNINKMIVEYSGSVGDDDSVSGKFHLDFLPANHTYEPEPSEGEHRNFKVKELAEEELAKLIVEELVKMDAIMVKEFRNKVQHDEENDPKNKFPKTPVYQASNSAAKVKTAPIASSSESKSAGSVSTSSFVDDAEFMTEPKDCYELFTKQSKVRDWAANSVKVWESSGDDAQKGKKFELFDGIVQGEYTELEPFRKIQQKWRLKDWPAGHYSNLQLEFEPKDNTTVVHLQWTGIPEDDVPRMKQNWHKRYLLSMKRHGYNAGP